MLTAEQQLYLLCWATCQHVSRPWSLSQVRWNGRDPLSVQRLVFNDFSPAQSCLVKLYPCLPFCVRTLLISIRCLRAFIRFRVVHLIFFRLFTLGGHSSPRFLPFTNSYCYLNHTCAAMDSRSETLAGEKEVGRSVSPSPPGSLNKERLEANGSFDESPTDKEDGSIRNSPAPAVEGDDDEGEYPDGFRMAMIVVALLLSIFLVCSHFPLHFEHSANLY